MKAIVCLAAVACLAWAQSCLARESEVFRWQDEQGQWHYTDATHVPPQASAQRFAESPLVSYVKTRPVKMAPPHTTSRKGTVVTRKRVGAIGGKRSPQEIREHCEAWRDGMRFKAFNNDERLKYEHECVTALKW